MGLQIVGHPTSKPGNQSWPGRPSELWEGSLEGSPSYGPCSYPTSVRPDWVLLSGQYGLSSALGDVYPNNWGADPAPIGL